MRRTLGTAVFSGMLGVTLFGIFLTPVFFYVIDRVGKRKDERPATTTCPVIEATDSSKKIFWRLARSDRGPYMPFSQVKRHFVKKLLERL